MEIRIDNLQQLEGAARQFVRLMANHNLFAFYGAMGAGKTTFIKAVCDALGITDPVSSPSFAICNEYALPDGRSLYHFDFYRIQRLSEVYDIGYEDYFYSDMPCFIEWPELIEELLPLDIVKVHISVNPDQSRLLQIDL